MEFWLRWFVTFLDVIMCCCLYLSFRNTKNESAVMGLGIMLFSYIASICLIWWD